MILQSCFPYYNTTWSVSGQFKKIILSEIQRASDLLECKQCDFSLVCESLALNTFSKALRFRIELTALNLADHVMTLIKGNVQSLLFNLRRVHEGLIRPLCDFDEVNESGSLMFYSIGFESSDFNLGESRIKGYCNEFIAEIRKRSHSSQFEILVETINFDK